MITDTEIEQKADELEISPQNVERDYVHGWLLHEIFAHQRLSNLLVLKGGNGIRKGYLPGTRYSKDLDFSCETALDENRLHADLAEILEAAKAASGVQFAMDRTRVAEKNLKIPGVQALEVRIYFKGFYAEESVTLRSHLDISEFEKPYLPIQTRPLLHPYSDHAACSGPSLPETRRAPGLETDHAALPAQSPGSVRSVLLDRIQQRLSRQPCRGRAHVSQKINL
jgi:hypothetical protein